MAQKIYFDGQLHVEPKSLAKIVGGGGNRVSPLNTGTVILIDTGIGAGYGGGLGAVSSGSIRDIDDFVYEFSDLNSLRTFLKGGKLWDVVEHLFRPSTQFRGPSKVYYMRAAETAPASEQITLASGGQFTITASKNEGTVGNGQKNATTNNLELGYAIKLRAGTENAAKFVVEIWRGTYKGADSNSNDFEGVNITNAALAPELVISSDEISTVDELKTWADGSDEFKAWFSFAKDTAGAFASGDLTTLAGFNLFSGGTETYSGTHLDSVLDVIDELDGNFFLALEGGSSAAGTNNVKILTHINSESQYRKFLIVGGGSTKSQFSTQSLTPAGTLNSINAILVHGGTKVPNPSNPEAEYIDRDAIYTAAKVCGLLASVSPQTPATHKELLIYQLQHNLTTVERKNAINGGVLAIRKDERRFIINHGVNTLQNNDGYIMADGTSPEISVERIKAQVEREIGIAAKAYIGENSYTVDSVMLESFVKDYLENNLVKQGIQDGMILSYSNVNAAKSGTAWTITYDFEVNGPINFVITIGTIIDLSI